MEINEEKIDKVIRNSYKNVEIPSYIFEEAYEKIRNEKKSRANYKFFFSFSAVFIIVIAIYLVGIINKSKIDNESAVPPMQGEKEEIQSELPVASDKINTIGDLYQPIQNYISPNNLTLVEQTAEFVGVVKVNKIIEYTNYIKRLDKYNQTPFIKSNVSIQKIFKGEIIDNFDMFSYGGVISVSDYEKSLTDGKTLQEKYSNMSEEEKENTFVSIYDTFTLNTIEPIVGKDYLVFIKFSNNLEGYQVLDTLIYEYDLENDMVKNPTNNTWEKYEFGK